MSMHSSCARLMTSTWCAERDPNGRSERTQPRRWPARLSRPSSGSRGPSLRARRSHPFRSLPIPSDPFDIRSLTHLPHLSPRLASRARHLLLGIQLTYMPPAPPANLHGLRSQLTGGAV